VWPPPCSTQRSTGNEASSCCTRPLLQQHWICGEGGGGVGGHGASKKRGGGGGGHAKSVARARSSESETQEVDQAVGSQSRKVGIRSATEVGQVGALQLALVARRSSPVPVGGTVASEKGGGSGADSAVSSLSALPRRLPIPFSTSPGPIRTRHTRIRTKSDQANTPLRGDVVWSVFSPQNSPTTPSLFSESRARASFSLPIATRAFCADLCVPPYRQPTRSPRPPVEEQRILSVKSARVRGREERTTLLSSSSPPSLPLVVPRPTRNPPKKNQNNNAKQPCL
jgi:hypothetical protein